MRGLRVTRVRGVPLAGEAVRSGELVYYFRIPLLQPSKST